MTQPLEVLTAHQRAAAGARCTCGADVVVVGHARHQLDQLALAGVAVMPHSVAADVLKAAAVLSVQLRTTHHQVSGPPSLHEAMRALRDATEPLAE